MRAAFVRKFAVFLGSVVYTALAASVFLATIFSTIYASLHSVLPHAVVSDVQNITAVKVLKRDADVLNSITPASCSHLYIFLVIGKTCFAKNWISFQFIIELLRLYFVIAGVEARYEILYSKHFAPTIVEEVGRVVIVLILFIDSVGHIELF